MTIRSSLACIPSALCITALALSLTFPVSAWAQEDGATVEEQPDGTTVIAPSRQRPPSISGAQSVSLEFAYDADLLSMLKFFAELRRMNFVLADVRELQGKKVSIISHTPVTPEAAWEAFLAAMQTSGFTVVEAGGLGRVVKIEEAGQSPLGVGKGVPRASDAFVTQLIQLENVSVSEVNKIITGLMPPQAKVVAYQPTNTMIITDTAHNLRKVHTILEELDVAAPRSTLEITPIRYANAADLRAVLEELYPTTEQQAEPAPQNAAARRRAARVRNRQLAQAAQADDAVTAGEEARFISKVLDDERSNSLIVLANEQGHEAVRDLIDELDRDVDPQNRAQIHVVYLENAKAEDVTRVLMELSQDSGGSSGGRNQNQRNPRNAANATSDEQTSVMAAFDSGMRIAADENTNSLVIIANHEDFRVVDSVIKKLDIIRKQVFVDAVIMELASDDSFQLGLAAHMPTQPSNNSMGFVGGQFGASSLGLTQDLLTGLAVGVFGESIEVPVTGPDGSAMMMGIPAFGVVLNALKSNSSVNIISNPNIMTLDNEEAEIVVGRRIPFPVTGGMTNFGAPLTTFQREDVAITLKVTPRVNSSNYVTLEVELEAQEIEEDSQGLNVSQAGFITSKREETTTVLIKDNQTVVLGGLVGTTDSEVETKLPILGDLPLIGAFFRGTSKQSRKTNLMIFLTPHIIETEEDMIEIQRVKEAQRQEFMRRFYGRSKDQYLSELRSLLRYSMNEVDQPSMFRGPAHVSRTLNLDGEPVSPDSRAAIEAELRRSRGEPGVGAGALPEDEVLEIREIPTPSAPPESEPPVDSGIQPAPAGGSAEPSQIEGD